jgi:hypothetical protein
MFMGLLKIIGESVVFNSTFTILSHSILFQLFLRCLFFKIKKALERQKAEGKVQKE